MADVFYRTPGADALDLWSGDSHDPRDVHSAYEAMSRQERDIAEARRRAATHADARRNKPRLRRLSSGNRSPYGSPGSRLLAPGEARRRDAAATRIQRIWRGGAGRSVATDRWVAVFQIQRFWRGALGRRRARAAQREKKARDEAEARAEEIDDITASVRARRERRTPGRPPAFDDERPCSPFERSQRSRVRFTPKKIIDWDAEPIAVEEDGDGRFPNAAKGERFADSAFFETARAGAAGPLRAESLAKTVAKDRNPIEPSREPTRSPSASLASPASLADSEHQSLFDEVDAVLLNAKLARRRLLGKTPASPGGLDSVSPASSSRRAAGGGSAKPRGGASSGARGANGSPFSDLSDDYRHWYLDDASPASTASVDGDAREKREAMPRYAAALASGFGGGRDSKRSHIRTELLPPARPVSARRSPSPRRDVTPPFADPKSPFAGLHPATSPGTSTREKLSATPAGIKARYEAARLEEERAFEEQMKTLQRKEREANARAAAAAAAAEAAAFLAASPGPRRSFPSLDDTAGSLGDLDIGRPGRASTGIERSPSPSPATSTRRSSARASPKRKEKVLPLWVDGFS